MKKLFFIFFSLNFFLSSNMQKVYSEELNEIIYMSTYLEGINLLSEGKFSEAEKKCEEAIELLPLAKNAYLCKGIALGLSSRKNTKREAIDNITKAIEIDPEFYEAYYWRGAIQFSMKRRHMDKTDKMACSDMRKAYLNKVSYAIDFVNKNKTRLVKDKCSGFKK